MKIFISWSGNTSRRCAEAFRDWLPSVIQAIQPYFSPEDIAKGARWAQEISRELEQSNFGLLLLTRDNILAPWLNFEAGALSKSISTARVCPILLGMEASEVSGPLSQFQHIAFQESEVRALLAQMNDTAKEGALQAEVFEKVWSKWWPDLDSSVSKILATEETDSIPKRSADDMLAEILELVRRRPVVMRSSAADHVQPLIGALEKYFDGVRSGYNIGSEDVFLINSILDSLEAVARRGLFHPTLTDRIIQLREGWKHLIVRSVDFEPDEDYNPFADE